MKILVDENIPNISIAELLSKGHDVLDIRGTPKQGIFDDELWVLAQNEKRMLITTDKGFSQYRDEKHDGILIIRLRQPNEERIIRGSSLRSNNSQTMNGRGCWSSCVTPVQSIHRS